MSIKKSRLCKISDFYDIQKIKFLFLFFKWKIIQKNIFDEFHQTHLYFASIYFKAMTLVIVLQ